MAKAALTKQEFVDEINARIKSHAAYKSGAVAKFYPEGASAETASGVMYEGPEQARAIFADVEAAVRREFAVDGEPQAEERS